MKKIMSILVATLLILSFNSVSLAAIQGSSSTRSTGAVVSDVLVLRPLGFVGTVLGGTAFVVSLHARVRSSRVYQGTPSGLGQRLHKALRDS